MESSGLPSQASTNEGQQKNDLEIQKQKSILGSLPKISEKSKSSPSRSNLSM